MNNVSRLITTFLQDVVKFLKLQGILRTVSKNDLKLAIVEKQVVDLCA